MLEQDVAHRAPEIPPVRGEGVLVVGFDISFLRGLDVFDGLGRSFVVVERGQEPRLHADVQFLHLRRVHAEVLPTQGPHAYELHLSLEDVDDHGQLVNPGFPEQAAPEVHPVVVGELSTLLQPLVLQHVGLEILGVGVHSPELIHADHLSLVPHTVQFHQHAAGRLVVPDGILHFLAQKEVLTFVITLVDYLETGPIHTSEQFHAAVSAVLPVGNPHIEPAGQAELREHTVPQVMQPDEHLAQETRELFLDYRPFQRRCSGIATDIPFIHEHLAGLVQEGVQVTDRVERPHVHNQNGVFSFQRIQGISVIRVHHIGVGVE